ncbi:hypothetical protein ADK67_41590 [Saccharothrix sp. NRRL B-16348]|uniref:hypothetical protein n=1 Tax=Saccharothrix sp. NRRL B-16348 TaxID=1415542 RepID=UPI0006AE3CDE|nr:hypothetical protein [Saccharothrix sp. NRRL B-16348]KOX15343.1 hypothetical protein ADK67_41590 [Saccharothrix sp. NRRL B-16348]
MVVFACARCDAVLTVPVSQVALPDHAHQLYGHELLPVLMEPGTYAVDPEPFGPPWRQWDEIGPDEAEARGVFAPVYAVSFGEPGAIVVAPGDVRGTVLIPERCEGYCLGLDGRDGPNLACARCGLEVATRVDDCSLWQAVWLAPRAVRRLPGAGPARPVVGWEALVDEWVDTPALWPAEAWGPWWEAAIGVALAHLLAASAGAPLALPDGPVAVAFERALEALLPPGPPVKQVALAGPGLPAVDPDIAVVPRHPGTGRVWQQPGGADIVPLAADVWLHLAFHQEPPPFPVTGGMPAGVLRDDPLPPPPPLRRHFRPDRAVFLRTLTRLPAVRQSWLRRIYDAAQERRF